MLATSNGQSIQSSRRDFVSLSFCRGSKVFNTGEEEQVVSVAWIAEKGEDADENELEAEDPT